MCVCFHKKLSDMSYRYSSDFNVCFYGKDLGTLPIKTNLLSII